MDGDEAQDDPFGVQLEWPEEQLAEPFETGTREVAPPDAAPPESTPSPTVFAPAPEPGVPASFSPPLPPTEPRPSAPPVSVPAPAPPVSGDNDMGLVLAKVVARVDALTSATTTFRNLVSDRVSEYTERVVQVASGTAADLEEQRRLAERDMGEVRSGVARANAAIESLAASVEALASEVDRIAGELGGQLDRVVDEVQTLRRRTAVRPRAAVRDDADADDAPPPRRPARKR